MKPFTFHSTAKLLVFIFCSLLISSKAMTAPNIDDNELTKALQSNNQQIKNIAEIIQRVNADIILLNEFDRVDDSSTNIHYFISKLHSIIV